MFAEITRVKFLFATSCILILSLLTLTCDRQVPHQSASTDAEALPTNSAQVEPDASDLAEVDQLLNEQRSQLGSFAVVLVKDNRVIYLKAFRNYRIDQVVPIASSSKWLAGALVMALVDEGKLSLDDPVAKYLPEFSGDKAQITVRQLFAHTSGLPPEIGCRNNRQTTLEACAKQIATAKLSATPGTEFFYGGVSMHVSGRVVEVAGGKPWNDMFVEKIARPLGMTNTDFFAYGPTSNPRPAGDARSTLDDYAKFLQMILNGGEFNGRRVLSAKAVEEMHRDQTRGSTIKYSIFWNKGHLDSTLPNGTYGVGMWGEKTDEQSGKILLASSPGALGSYPWIDFKTKTAGAIFTRGTFSRTLPVYLRLKEALHQTANKR
jgi:CubicO group peptidase (beta-lactamase class C family)